MKNKTVEETSNLLNREISNRELRNYFELSYKEQFRRNIG
jgi:hypothetical protein